MAAQVLSGSGNVSYTNSTGQNVRLVINYLQTEGSADSTITFPGFSLNLQRKTRIGKMLAYIDYPAKDRASISMAWADDETSDARMAIPLEVGLANGQTFSVTNPTSSDIKGYNIIIIPEAG